MGLSLEQKKAMVQEVAAVAQQAHSAVAAEYRGLSAVTMDGLRNAARKEKVYLRVVKNTLARRAVEGTPFECMREGFSGPLLLAFSQDDPGAVGRVLKDFSRTNDKLVIKFIALGGALLPGSEIDRLAKMPTRDEALALLMATMRAPIQKLAQTLNEVPGKLVRTVAAVKDAKQS